MLLSSINVYLRDTQHLIEVILTAWFWACPIVYSYQANDRQQARAQGPDLGLLPQPDDAARAVVPALHLRPPHDLRRGRTASSTTCYVLPTKGIVWYVGLDLAVLVPVASCLFLVALAVFGRLEGNFAEEL